MHLEIVPCTESCFDIYLFFGHFPDELLEIKKNYISHIKLNDAEMLSVNTILYMPLILFSQYTLLFQT